MLFMDSPCPFGGQFLSGVLAKGQLGLGFKGEKGIAQQVVASGWGILTLKQAVEEAALSSAFLLQPQALTHSMDTEARNTLEPGSPPYLALE